MRARSQSHALPRMGGLFALLALTLAACAPSSADAPIPEQWRSVAVDVRPVALGAQQIGALRFRGGLDLRSEDAAFGGFSDLEVLEDGRVIAVSDAGLWLSARLALDDTGALKGLDQPRLAMMRDEHGQVFEEKRNGDAEDLAQLPDGRFAVAFETTQTIRLYDLNRDGPFGAALAGPPLAGTARLAENVGLEALASTADGALVVGAEQGGRAGAPVWRTPLDSSAPAEPATHFSLPLGFGFSGLDRLPDGNFVSLERLYAPLIGARIRLSVLDAAALEAGQIRKTQLALLASPLSLDNFEGVSVARAPDGGVRLYLISDNNFDRRERTLLYAFDVVASPR